MADKNLQFLDIPRADPAKTPVETRVTNFDDRYNHELIDISRIHAESMQSHLQHLEGLLEQHVAETGSAWAEEIVNDLRSYIGKFWVVKPKAASIDSLIENLRRAA